MDADHCVEAEVAEGLVALAHRLLEPSLGCVLLKGESLGRVAGDPVEERAHDLRRVKPLCIERLVHQELVHDELVDRHAGDPLEQVLERPVQLVSGRRLSR